MERKDLKGILAKAKQVMEMTGEITTGQQQAVRQPQTPITHKPIQSEQKIKPINSNLPKEILESMISNPIETNHPAAQMLDPKSSVLDVIGGIDELYDTTPQITQEPVYNNTQIDYSLIKMMINESIREAMNELKKTVLSDNKLYCIKIGNNQKLQLIDNKGNVYDTTLKYVKNISKK